MSGGEDLSPEVVGLEFIASLYNEGESVPPLSKSSEESKNVTENPTFKSSSVDDATASFAHSKDSPIRVAVRKMSARAAATLARLQAATDHHSKVMDAELPLTTVRLACVVGKIVVTIGASEAG